MSDLISRQTAIDAVQGIGRLATLPDNDAVVRMSAVEYVLFNLPSAQPERTEYIPDTKAIPSEKDCVDLSERVTATFYDEEHEEWSQKTVTIRDVLDSVCDEYTILPSAQPEEDCDTCKHGYFGDDQCNNCRVRYPSHYERRTDESD